MRYSLFNHVNRELLKARQEQLQNYERVELIPLLDKSANKANILRVLRDLQSRVQPEDAVIIYFAGHGIAEGQQFYLIPHDLGYRGRRDDLDEAGLQQILAQSISDRELEQVLAALDTGPMFLVIDACNSGQVLGDKKERRGPMNSPGLAQLAYEKGMSILTASESFEIARGAGRLGHGYLTYALVEEGLKTAVADTAPRDGQVFLREWFDYAARRVPHIQAEEQEKRRLKRPQPAAPNAPEPAESKLQHPRVFYRRETEARPLIVAKP